LGVFTYVVCSRIHVFLALFDTTAFAHKSQEDPVLRWETKMTSEGKSNNNNTIITTIFGDLRTVSVFIVRQLPNYRSE